MLTIWSILLVLGIPFGLMGTGMAFEGGYTFGAYFFIVTTWSYPVLVAMAVLFRRKKPRLIWLPALPLLVMALSYFSNWP